MRARISIKAAGGTSALVILCAAVIAVGGRAVLLASLAALAGALFGGLASRTARYVAWNMMYAAWLGTALTMTGVMVVLTEGDWKVRTLVGVTVLDVFLCVSLAILSRCRAPTSRRTGSPKRAG